MLNRLRGLFGKDDTLADKEFQRRVCAVFSELSPATKPVPTADPLVIEIGNIKVGLTNIRSKFDASTRSECDLRAIVSEHLPALIETRNQMDADTPNWDTAAPVLMPQLVPDGRFGGMPMLSIPFCSEIRIAFVLDSERTMSYVSDETLQSWDVNIKQVLDRAIDNLEM